MLARAQRTADRLSDAGRDDGSPRVRWHARRATLLVALLGILVSAWALVNLVIDQGFVLFVSETLQGEEEAVSSLARFFAALVLALFSAERSGRRLGWVAAGLVVLGLGPLTCGYLEPILTGRASGFEEGLYESLVTRTAACVFLAVGLVPRSPPRPSVWVLGAVILAFVLGQMLYFEVLGGVEYLPPLVYDGDLRGTSSPFEQLTPWHWALGAVSLLLAVAATVGALRRGDGAVPVWLPVALVLLAGAMLHEYLWPTPYGGDELTSADLLRLAFAVVVVVGGVLEMRRMASERAALLAAERERTRRLEELAALKADFSTMVAHELCGPVAAIRNLTELVEDDGLRDYALRSLQHETDVLDDMISDVRTAAAVEHDDFEVRARPVPLAELLSDAEAYMNAAPGGRTARVLLDGLDGHEEEVMADPVRVGQVLRNLLSNAFKYSPPETSVELRVSRTDGRVRIEVADQGSGIHPDDLHRIFEKFGRGRDREGKKVPGVGLGLYLSRRIVRAHGSELAVRTKPGEGSVFSFKLEIVP